MVDAQGVIAERFASLDMVLRDDLEKIAEWVWNDGVEKEISPDYLNQEGERTST